MGFLSLYIYSLPPHLAPYRDSGEMACVTSTLGVAHPPGYPLYTLAGHIFSHFPLGSKTFRINLFSALMGALCLVLVFNFLQKSFSISSALIAVMFLGLSFPFWELSLVSEMYSMGAFLMVLILLSALLYKKTELTFFLWGLTLGVRMDLLLLFPLLVYIFWKEWNWKLIRNCSLCFLLGTSIFIYLLIRSKQDPLLDWANPDNLLAVLFSAMRKNYSGTLDLLSLSYKKGENFTANLLLYGKHLVSSFGWWGLAAILGGASSYFVKDRKSFYFLIVLFFVMGPLFIFLGNLPPNPHAVAIVEASYLFPDIILVFFIGAGLNYIFRLKNKLIFIVLSISLLAFNSVYAYKKCTKRSHWYVNDYQTNVSRSLPPRSRAVFQKDVQLFSFWEYQLLQKKRQDLLFLSGGLSASPWYWDMLQRWPHGKTVPINFKEVDGWLFAATSLDGRGFYSGFDTEWKLKSPLTIKPHGWVVKIATHINSSNFLIQQQLRYLSVFRGRYKYGDTPDFFSTDLIGDAARAFHQEGFYRYNNKLGGGAWFIAKSESLDPTFPRPNSDLGYFSLINGDFEKGILEYEKAIYKLEALLKLTKVYRSLPETVSGYKLDTSNAYLHLGVCQERLGRINEAREAYEKAILTLPSAQGHYNMAVTYWGKDWEKVIFHLRQAVDLNPQMIEARTYLSRAEQIGKNNDKYR
jgi:tetratricopeptide (TPR) repeat protein